MAGQQTAVAGKNFLLICLFCPVPYHSITFILQNHQMLCDVMFSCKSAIRMAFPSFSVQHSLTCRSEPDLQGHFYCMHGVQEIERNGCEFGPHGTVCENVAYVCDCLAMWTVLISYFPSASQHQDWVFLLLPQMWQKLIMQIFYFS
jgi:hypothetical protein